MQEPLFGLAALGRDSSSQAQQASGSSMAPPSLLIFFQEMESARQNIAMLHALLDEAQDIHERGASSSLEPGAGRKALQDLLSQAVCQAQQVLHQLRLLDQHHTQARALPNGGPGSSRDRVRGCLLGVLGRHLRVVMRQFAGLRDHLRHQEREQLRRCMRCALGREVDEEELERLIRPGGLGLLHKLLRNQEGPSKPPATAVESASVQVQSTMAVEECLQQLHQHFLDMSALVQDQGDALLQAEGRADAIAIPIKGMPGLALATETQGAKSRRCTMTKVLVCSGVVLLLVAAAIVVLALFASR